MKVQDSNGGTNHLFPLSNGLLTREHRKKMGSAVWEFLWFIDRTTSEGDGYGIVLGGQPVTYARIAQCLGSSERAVRANCQRLKFHGYIRVKRTPHGSQVWVAKSKKFAWKRLAEIRRLLHSGVEENCLSDRQQTATQIGRNLPMHIDDTTHNTQDRKQAPRRFGSIGKAWKILGLSYPIGSPEFRNSWESLFEDGNGQALSLLMEECITYCRDKDIRVPREFFTLKHGTEDREDDMVKLEAPL
jgi:hypothetical protein